MELRGKLLSYFISIIVVVVLVFGFLAYQIAYDAAIIKERELLTSLMSQEADMLSGVYKKTRSLHDLQQHVGTYSQEHHLSMIANTDEPDIFVRQFQDVLPTSNNPTLPEQLLQTSSNSGKLKIDGSLYVWARTEIPGTSYSLLHLYRSTYNSKPFEGLAARLITTGLFILWVIGWLALIIATTISRRLDVKTEALKYQALHDKLTDLPNRALLHRNLEQAIHVAKIRDKSVAIIMMDLDRFKEINNTLGHHIGDILLQEVGKRLRKVLWDSDTVARLGGDEFAMLLPMASASHSTLIVNKVLQAFDQPFTVEGLTLDMDASIGIALYPEHGNDAITLMRRADVAMYVAKNSGSGYTFYDSEKDPHSLKRLTLMADLRNATVNDELKLHYQPKIDLSGGTVLGAEALVRWQHPAHGLIAPDGFIPLAEQSGMIKPLTLWVLHKAINQCAKWHKAGSPMTISVNLSASILHDLQIPNQVSAILRSEGLAPQWLELEITETAIMMDPTKAIEVLRQLDVMGVRLSIDDFGTGYTSLTYLKQLPMDEIKIDKSFVINMLNDPENAIIVRSIIDLAHNMGRKVVAEGIEDKDTYENLTQQGCDIGQGYYMSRPLPAGEFSDWLSNSDWQLAANTAQKYARKNNA